MTRRPLAVLVLWAISGLTAIAANSVVDFFRAPQTVLSALSPSGDSIAIAEQVDSHARLSLYTLGTGDRRVVFDASESLRSESSFVIEVRWIDDELLAVTLTENRQAVAELLDTKQARNVYIVDVTVQAEQEFKTVYSIRSDGVLVNALPDTPGEMLYATAGRVSRLFRIDARQLNRLGERLTRTTLIDGGQFNVNNEVAGFDGYVLRWFTEPGGSVRSVFAIKPGNLVGIYAYDTTGKSWEEKKTWPLDSVTSAASTEERQALEFIIPLAQADTPDEYYAVVETEGQSDGLYRYNVTTGTKSLVYRHASADIHRVVLDKERSRIRGVGVIEGGDIRYNYIDEGAFAATTEVAQSFPGRFVSVVDSDLGGQRYLIKTHSFADPGQFHLLDTASGELTDVQKMMPWFEVNSDAVQVTDEVSSHGLQIPYLLTLPGSETGPYPLVLFPHGGPHRACRRAQLQPGGSVPHLERHCRSASQLPGVVRVYRRIARGRQERIRRKDSRRHRGRAGCGHWS